MRYLLTSVAILVACPALAAQYEVTAPVAEVTLYPQGASVTRIFQLDLPEGGHEIVIPGLPRDTDPASLRIAAEDATIGAVSLQQDRALPDTSADPATIQAARDEVRRLERSLRERDAAAALIRAEAQTAQDMIQFLMNLSETEGAATGDVAVLSATVNQQILAARQTTIDAETRALAVEQGREDDVRLLDNARAQLAALQQPQSPDTAALVVTVEGQGKPATIRITGHSPQAGWQPVYDLRLDQEAETLVLERGLLVSQSTGEDWSGVTLTLSTSRPSQQSAPSEVRPSLYAIYDPGEGSAADSVRSRSAGASRVLMEAEMDAVLEPAPVVAAAATVDFMGATAVYHYGAPVDLRNGVDSLRLKLDEQNLPIEELLAEAVPSLDSTAFLVVDSVNPLQDVILPGPVSIYADGAMVGQGWLDLIAAGEDMELGFGAIDGILLEHRSPDRLSSDSGFIRRSSEITETLILSARNVTGRDYTLRMIDRVPVSSQEDLEVEWSASADPTEQDPDGRRGVLVWEMPLDAGETQEVTLETSIRWPEHMRLQHAVAQPEQARNVRIEPGIPGVDFIR